MKWIEFQALIREGFRVIRVFLTFLNISPCWKSPLSLLCAVPPESTPHDCLHAQPCKRADLEIILSIIFGLGAL